MIIYKKPAPTDIICKRPVRPDGMFANCGRARYNGLRMCKAMGRACARQWLAHVQSNGMRMAMVHVNGAIKAIGWACASQLSAHMQSN